MLLPNKSPISAGKTSEAENGREYNVKTPDLIWLTNSNKEPKV